MSPDGLTLTEQETNLNLVADNRGTWHVYSDDPVMQRKFEAIGAVLVREDKYGPGKHYTLRADQVLLRRGKPKRQPLTEEQGRELSKRLRRS